MNKEKEPYNQVQGDYPQKGVPQSHSSDPSNSDIEKVKRIYMPDSKDNYVPSEETIEDVNGLEYSKPKTLF